MLTFDLGRSEGNLELLRGGPKFYFESYDEVDGRYRATIIGLPGLHLEVSRRRRG